MAESFGERVWQAVEARLGPLGSAAQEAYAKDIERFAEAAAPEELAAEVVCDRIQAARMMVAAGLDAYQGLVASVELASDAVTQGPDATRVYEHLLETKARIARLYHFLAGIAARGDVSGVAPVEVTQAMVAESEAELEAWRARGAEPG